MQKANSKKVIIAALIGNFLVTISKFIASALTGSIAMLAEAFHSVADTGNQILLLLGFKLARRPADASHPFGYGMERYFWSFIVGMSIFIIGAVISIYHGIDRLLHPHELGNLTANYVVLALAICFEGYSWTIAMLELRKAVKGQSLIMAVKKTKSPALIVVFLEDSAAMVGLAIALVGVFLADITGNSVWDGVASIAIGVILAGVAFIISYETRSLLLGEGLEREDLDKVKQAIESVPEVNQCYTLLTMYLSPDEVLVNTQVHMVDGLDTDGVEQAIDKIEAAIEKTLPAVGQIFVEVEDTHKGTSVRPITPGAPSNDSKD